jgi:hypothetical protein
MNKNKLKAYAPAARRQFIQAVTDRGCGVIFEISYGKTAPWTDSGVIRPNFAGSTEGAAFLTGAL